MVAMIQMYLFLGFDTSKAAISWASWDWLILGRAKTVRVAPKRRLVRCAVDLAVQRGDVVSHRVRGQPQFLGDPASPRPSQMNRNACRSRLVKVSAAVSRSCCFVELRSVASFSIRPRLNQDVSAMTWSIAATSSRFGSLPHGDIEDGAEYAVPRRPP